jgi:hypothetical protein
MMSVFFFVTQILSSACKSTKDHGLERLLHVSPLYPKYILIIITKHRQKTFLSLSLQ